MPSRLPATISIATLTPIAASAHVYQHQPPPLLGKDLAPSHTATEGGAPNLYWSASQPI